jgi:hypothetical protein
LASPKATKKPANPLIDYLFKRFFYIWDRKWAEKLDGMEEGKKQEWSDAISGMTRKQLDAAIIEARNQFKWPPEISEFLPLCRGEPIVQPNHFNCSVPGCPDVGSMCDSTFGSNWVCNKHWRMNNGR